MFLGRSCATSLLIILAACGPKMSVRYMRGPGNGDSYLLSSALIVTAHVKSKKEIGWTQDIPDHGSAQLCHLTLSVEQVLQGPKTEGDIDVYTLERRGNLNGPLLPLQFSPGDYCIFYLQKEQGKWRTACDLTERCVDYIKTGWHPAFGRKSDRPIADDILQILYTRDPDGISSGRMVDVLSNSLHTTGHYWIDDRRGTFISLLQNMAQAETPPVRAEACEVLREMGRPCRDCSETK
jgi:hypothetical protein